jgi:DNA polymerase-1
MVADYLLAPGQRSHGLDQLARRYLDYDTIPISDLIGKGRDTKRMDEVDVARVTEYSAEDANVAMRLEVLLRPALEAKGLTPLFAAVEMPLVEVLAEMEFNGIAVDPDVLRRLSLDFAREMERLKSQIHELAGTEFNVDSPKQLAQILFERLQLPKVKKTATGLSTDSDVLQELAARHPLPGLVIEYRQFAKLKGTYTDALLDLIHPQTRRIHTSFVQEVAATGRLSSKDPNLQNIPIRTETGRRIREAFVPDPRDWRLLTADYSQIELRMLAHFSQDETLLEAFRTDRDIHAVVAAQVHQVPLGEVTFEMRRRAKAVNFGIIYGQSAFGLSQALSISKEDAAGFINAYFAQYPGVARFLDEVVASARRDGLVRTMLGRQRPIEFGLSDAARGDDSTASRLRQRSLAERIAINTVIQGSAADLIKMAMIRVHQAIRQRRLEARLLLQIHDELLLEVSPAACADVARMLRDEMENAIELRVPIRVDIESGPSWGKTEPLLVHD